MMLRCLPALVRSDPPCSRRSMAGIGGRLLPVRKRAVRRRARHGRVPCPPARAVWSSVALVALALAIPVIVATNPVDPTLLPGLYDDADPDQLVSHALSPESWLDAAIPVILCVLSTIAFAWSRRLEWRHPDRRDQVARAPPGLPALSARVFSVDLRSAGRALLAHLTIRRSSSLRRFRHTSTSGIDTTGIEEGAKGSPASNSSELAISHDNTLDEPMREGFVCLALQSVIGRANTGRAQVGLVVAWRCGQSVVTVCRWARSRRRRH